MDRSDYSELQKNSLQENTSKLTELGIKAVKSLPDPSRKRVRPPTFLVEDVWAPKRKPEVQTGNRRGRKPVSYIESDDPDDPDFDVDDAGVVDDSDGSHSGSHGLSREAKTGRTSSEFVDADNNLFCEDCKKYYDGDCTVHGPLFIVRDVPVPADPKDKNRAVKTAPSQVKVSGSKTPDAEKSVLATKIIPARTRFGPYQGEITSSNSLGSYCRQIKKNGNILHCIDGKNPGLSNWMRYVKRARNDGEQNLNAFQYKGEVFYRSIRAITANEELLVWFGDTYGQQLGLHPDKATKNGNKEVTSFKCPGCSIAYVSKDYVDRHIKVCRKLRSNDCANEIYKCPGCHCAYSTPEYLDRHKRVCRKIETANLSGEMFKCTGCQCAYASAEYLERHRKVCKELETKKVSREVFTCVGCKCAYSSVEYLDRHKRICRQLETKKAPDAMFKCSACQTAYAEQKYLDRHMKICRQMELTNSTDLSTKHECPACHSVYIDITFLERHRKVCERAETNGWNGKEKPRFECSGCHSTYGNVEFLDRHKLTCSKLNPPKRPDPMKCPTCPRAFTEQAMLNRHQRNCAKLPPTNLNALKDEEEDGRSFEDNSDDGKVALPRVPKIRIMGLGTGPYVKSDLPYVLLKRVPYFDSGMYGFSDTSTTTPLKCPDCNERFTHEARLEAHRLTHLSQTVFVCSQCWKTFVNKETLTDHVMSHNRGDISFSSLQTYDD